MPIVYVHGVGVRDPGDPDYAAAQRLTQGADWAEVEAGLREHVAPALRPKKPDRVELLRVYWGDLGAQDEDPVDTVLPEFAPAAVPASLAVDQLGESLQRKLFDEFPPSAWPAAVRAVWEVVQDSATHAQLAARTPRRQTTWLEKRVRTRMHKYEPELGQRVAGLVADWTARRRHTVRLTMGEVRRPFNEVLPTFVGDVLSYLDGRGTSQQPGLIARRVIDALQAAASPDVERAPGEPLVVLSHSMGGQLVYDALTGFEPWAREAASGRSGDGSASTGREGGIPRVDFWCASAGQLGLFAELGMFLRRESPARVPVPVERLGYLWNAWSSTDVLSFPAEGRVAGAHDADFAWPGNPATTHLAYLREPDFYRTLAATVEAHCRRPRRR